MAGVALCLAMLPVNRLLADRIQKASLKMMGHKDARESCWYHMYGVYTILYAWYMNL